MNTESITKEIEIVWLRRISQSQPTAWEGRTRGHQAVHIFYKYGRLEVWLRCPVTAGTGAFKWVTIVSFHPEWLETEIEIGRNWPGVRRNGSQRNARREAWLLFERKMLAEMRTADSGRLDEFGRPRGRVIAVGQLAHWLALRNREMARHHGAASNGIRVELTAWTDEP
jgi:hypothetical protein